VTQRKEIRERDIQGLKYLALLLPMLGRLHEVGCQRDKAGNRQLHYDEYCLLVLLFLFNPVVRSLRSLQQASQLKNVQKRLGCARASLGSLSEAIEVFDPPRLEGIIEELLAQVPTTANVGRGYAQQALTAVDGSVVKTLSSLAQAAYLRDKNGKRHSGWRFHTHFDIDRRVPTQIFEPVRNIGHAEGLPEAISTKLARQRILRRCVIFVRRKPFHYRVPVAGKAFVIDECRVQIF
jgi:hypothetical protein